MDSEYRAFVATLVVCVVFCIGLVVAHIPNPNATATRIDTVSVTEIKLIAVGGDTFRHGAWIAITDQGEFFFEPKRARLRAGVQKVEFLYHENVFGMGFWMINRII